MGCVKQKEELYSNYFSCASWITQVVTHSLAHCLIPDVNRKLSEVASTWRIKPVLCFQSALKRKQTSNSNYSPEGQMSKRGVQRLCRTSEGRLRQEDKGQTVTGGEQQFTGEEDVQRQEGLTGWE